MRISPTNKPQIIITMGDPAGIGPEVIARAMASPSFEGLAIFLVIGDRSVMEKAFSRFSSVKLHVIDTKEEDIVLKEGAINILDPGGSLEDHAPGKPTSKGSLKALNSLKTAVELMQSSGNETPKALVTAPLSKEGIAGVHPGFIGHTEYLQEAYSREFVTMVMVGKTMSVVPVTRHIPLKEVASSLTKDLIIKTLHQVIGARKLISGKEDAVIGVSALNPHSGEGGKIGTEEIDIIAPAVKEVKAVYPNIEGPVSADVIFYKALKKKIDIVVAMYHDQCLSPFKMMEFDSGVNMTLGLEHVRTSPDHGTAFDIAGKNIANPESMENAIKLAIQGITGT